jgi:hypothetical protein
MSVSFSVFVGPFLEIPVPQGAKIPSPYDLGERFVDVVFMPESITCDARKSGKAYWLPNHRGFGECFSRDRAQVILELEEGARTRAIEKFRDAHRALIEEINRLYGTPPLIRYGVVPFQS